MFEASVLPLIRTSKDVRDARREPTTDNQDALWKYKIERIDGVVYDLIVREFIWHSASMRPSGIQMLFWVTRILPAIVLLLISPDRRDEPFFQQASSTTDIYTFARMGVRVLVIATVLATAIFIAWGHWVILAGISSLLLVALSLRSMNIVGDVQVAAFEDRKVEKIKTDLENAYTELRRDVGRTVVVAHSQGGFLAHQWLLDRCRSKPMKELNCFVGVGSGLKPIYLLRALRYRKVWLSTWLLLAGTLVVIFGFWVLMLAVADIYKMLFTFSEITAILLLYPSNSQQYQAALRASDTFVSHEFKSWASALPGTLERGAWVLMLIFAGICLGTAAWRWSLSPWLDNGGRDLGISSLRGKWVEHSSHQDMVGRLALPQLLHASEQPVTGVGHPLLDHTSYFHPGSRVSWSVASALARSSNSDLFTLPNPRYLASEERRSQRRQQAAFTVRTVAALIFLVLAFPRTESTMSIGGAAATGPQVASVAIWLLLFMVIISSCITFFGLRDRQVSWTRLRTVSGQSDGSGETTIDVSGTPPSRVRTTIGFVALVGPLSVGPGLIFHSGDADLTNFASPSWFLGCALFLGFMSVGGAMVLAGYNLRAYCVAFLVVGFMALWVLAVGPGNLTSEEIWRQPLNAPEVAIPLMLVLVSCLATLVWLLACVLSPRSQIAPVEGKDD